MQQRLGQLAVVGEQERAAGVEVEAADGEDALGDALEQIGEAGPALGVARVVTISRGLCSR